MDVPLYHHSGSSKIVSYGYRFNNSELPQFPGWDR